jgi:hypothetical protein
MTTRELVTREIAFLQGVLETLPPDPVVSAPWPNQPAGFAFVSDQDWRDIRANGWNYLRRSSSKDSTVVSDLLRSHVLRIVFTAGMARDSGPCVHWVGLPTKPRELYAGWTMKLSPNWTPSPAGGGKIAFVHLAGGGQVYINLGGSIAPHRINVNTEWAPYGQKFWEPTVANASVVSYGMWTTVEWYLKASSKAGVADGIVRWWVNGQLSGDHRNVIVPPVGFEQFEFSPTRQLSPATEQYLYIDHTRVSAPGL